MTALHPSTSRTCGADTARLACCALAVWALCFIAPCRAETPGFVAPPHTTSDIEAILSGEKRDTERFAKFQSSATNPAPATEDKKELARFYFQRGEARGSLGRVKEGIADIEKAIALAREEKMGGVLLRYQQLLGALDGWAGNTKRSLDTFTRVEREAREINPFNNARFNAQRWMGINYIALGDLDKAEAAMSANRELLRDALKRTEWANGDFRATAEAHIAFGNAAILEARGKFLEAAQAYRDAEGFYRTTLRKYNSLKQAPLRSNIEQVSDWMTARTARVEARGGQLAEAEADVRRSLLNWIKLGGKYNLNTARIIGVFASVMIEQARYAEAESLARSEIEIYESIGAEKDSQVYAICLNQLAGIQALRGDWQGAAKTYAALDEATNKWEQSRKEEIGFDITRVLAAYNANNVAAGIAIAERLVTRLTIRLGEGHIDTMLARGVMASGQFRAGKTDVATENFKAVPLLLAAERSAQSSDDDAVQAAAREQRVKFVVESYIGLLATRGPGAATESFRMAESIRGRSVQKALAASSTRALARDPALASLARTEQDLQKQIGAQLGLLNSVLALPPEQRDDKAIAELRSATERLRTQHEAARTQLTQQFPDYADLVDPQPPAVAAIQAALRPDEALLSFYFGKEQSYVWALRKNTPMAFAAIPLSAAEAESKIVKLREALEPNAATIAEIPAFDLALSHRLYTQLLQPLEASWKPAKSLIVITNGALGLLPLGLLTTSPSTLKAGTMFSGYRDVPWLARSHAVTLVPSAAALRTLRSLPPGSDKRERMIGFGDPLFSAKQAMEASQNVAPVQLASATRGVPLIRRAAPQTAGVQSAELALLPRLPDTAEELKSVALALQADPSKALRLGKAANEDAVKKADLSNYRIIVFATHGLVPGELDGLTQPALALSAPDVAGVAGDGLLTMEEILSLKLNADWVVLSACNTGTGAGAGAEAASGLGRAFFYAGTRAILVTNWSVHSASARELVTDLFRRQTADPKLTRGEALRQASMALVDSAGFIGSDGKAAFSYAHPLFWAPYSIIGDGG